MIGLSSPGAGEGQPRGILVNTVTAHCTVRLSLNGSTRRYSGEWAAREGTDFSPLHLPARYDLARHITLRRVERDAAFRRAVRIPRVAVSIIDDATTEATERCHLPARSPASKQAASSILGICICKLHLHWSPNVSNSTSSKAHFEDTARFAVNDLIK